MRNMTSDNQTDQTMTLTTPKPLLMSIDDEIARLRTMNHDLLLLNRDFTTILAQRDKFHQALNEIARTTHDGTAAGIAAKALNS